LVAQSAEPWFFSNAFSAWHLADVQILAALRIQDMVESMLRFSGGWVAEVPIPDIHRYRSIITCPGLSQENFKIEYLEIPNIGVEGLRLCMPKKHRFPWGVHDVGSQLQVDVGCSSYPFQLVPWSPSNQSKPFGFELISRRNPESWE
jgi:hypothetical protein